MSYFFNISEDWTLDRKDVYESEQPILYNPDSVLSFEQLRQRLPIFKVPTVYSLKLIFHYDMLMLFYLNCK